MTIKEGDTVRYITGGTHVDTVFEIDGPLVFLKDHGWVSVDEIKPVGNPNIRALLLGIYTAFFLLGLTAGLLINFNGSNPPAVNCNNMSANDGPEYAERDITEYEFDVYCR